MMLFIKLKWCSLGGGGGGELSSDPRGRFAFCIHVGKRDVDFVPCPSLQGFAQKLTTWKIRCKTVVLVT